MNKLRVALVIAVLVALMVPVTALAAGTYYCSTLLTSGGNGTYNYPWSCVDQEQLDYVIYDRICNVGGGYLYQIYSGYYVYYVIEWVNGQCTITHQTRHDGYPPNTGVDLPMPLLVGIAVGGGLVLVVAGLALRRKSTAS
jgi:hypothetical protein